MKFLTGLLILLIPGMQHALAQEAAIQAQWDTTSVTEWLQHARKLTLAGQTDSAKIIFSSAYSQSLALNYNYGLVKSEIGLGNIAINRGEHSLALKYYQEALVHAQLAQNKVLLTTIYNNIGNIYTLQGNYPDGVQQYELALTASKKYGSELHLETIYNNLSISLNKLGRPGRSLYYLSKAEALALESNNQVTLADVYNNMGTAYTELKNTEKSLYYFNQAVTIARNNAYLNTLFSGLVNLGIVYLNQGKTKQALQALNEAEPLQAQANDYYRNLYTLTSGAVRLKINDLPGAEQLLLRSLAQAKALDNIKDLQSTHMLLAELYGKTGAYRKAFEHKSEELVLLDSMKSQEAAGRVAEIESKYRSALRDEALARETLTVSRQVQAIARKNRWIAIGCGALLLLLLFAFFQRRSFRQKQKLKDGQLRNLEQQQKYIEMQAIMDGAEKERIRLSREIHDHLMVQFSVVKMNLSTILHADTEARTAERLLPVMQQLDMATDHLRHIAHNLMPDRIREDGLVEAVQYFCDSITKTAPLRVSFLTIGEMPALPQKFELSLYRIIQELMQNIIKHAHATEAIVQLSCSNDYLGITVEDNGAGMTVPVETEGLGLKSIAARVNEYGGKMNIEGAQQVGTTVQLEFHLQDIGNS